MTTSSTTSSTAGADLLAAIFETVREEMLGSRINLRVHINPLDIVDDHDAMMGPWPAAFVRLEAPWFWLWRREHHARRLEASIRKRTGQWVQVVAV
jgi:hypothetical protein